MKKRTQIWSSGGGTQSTAIAALIVMGKLPKPDLAVIADTEREMSSTWDYLARYVQPALDSVGVTLHRVKKSQYATKDLYGGKHDDTLLIPGFTTAGDCPGKLPGYCSGEWKRDVIRRWATKEHGVRAANLWIGYTIDEMARAKRNSESPRSKGKWESVYPLIDLNLTRGDCIELVERDMGWPRPRSSSCWMCPNYNMREWREVRESPEDWRRAVQFDEYIRKRDPHVWLTSECVPLAEADLSDEQEVMFGRNRGECVSGLCFV